jgi:predicted alpha/beta superfamily hydrolase
MLQGLLRECCWLTVALTIGYALPGSAQVVLKITRLPADTPSADTVFVAGSFNSWNPHRLAYALHHNPDGTWQLVLPAGLGALEYKFTLGSWGRAELDAQRQPLPNRLAPAEQRGELLHEVLNWDNQAPATPPKSTVSPQVQVLANNFRMPQLGGRPRRVWIYLPADYARQPRRRYPVLYLHDGQNVFDAATSFSGEWGVDETLDRLQANGQDRTSCIVVAVDNGGELRMDEYIPWRNAELKKGGQGGAYVDFLARTLKPYVDAHYRTRPEAASTAVAGSSLGGLISFYAALRYPKVFGRVGVFSPAFWVCNDSLKTYFTAHPAAPTARFYFVCGPQESETMLPLMVAWRDALRAAGVPATHLRLQAPADGQHREWFWQREFSAAYQWLFGANKTKN